MSATAKPPETRWQRFMRSLLYGRDVDRNVKAKARLGLAIVAFALIYGVIAPAARHVRRRTATATAAAAASARTPSPPRGPTFSTATA